MGTTRFRRLWIALVALLPMYGGCGLKSDPIPPRMKTPAAIADLTVESSRLGVLLSWSVDPRESMGAIRILRTEPVRQSEACPGCPQEYRPLRTVPFADPGLRSEAGRKFYYVDWDVAAGNFYSYRIAVCDRSGSCGAASNEAGLVFK